MHGLFGGWLGPSPSMRSNPHPHPSRRLPVSSSDTAVYLVVAHAHIDARVMYLSIGCDSGYSTDSSINAGGWIVSSAWQLSFDQPTTYTPNPCLISVHCKYVLDANEEVVVNFQSLLLKKHFGEQCLTDGCDEKPGRMLVYLTCL